MFRKVLIANRGAIAVRIERTLKKLGIQSVAVYTKADQDSLHVDYADEAVLIGEGPVKDSYLNADKILQVAIEHGVDAIHPGYGFLSENPDFVKACEEKGIVFIGPTQEQMKVFGLKHTARNIAEKVGVPIMPGTPLLLNIEDAKTSAYTIGYPVMLKSTAGGGGIGMRVCENEKELTEAFESVCHLAKTNFKNAGVFIEKYIPKARHVEVQIFGNKFGEVVTLGERDCSIQRRNQKVIEESPAPKFPESIRKAMCKASLDLAKEVGYRSAGTVEFLYDPETFNFYFLEVNTRLQVEHGVTEEVLGIDLVEMMIKEAADELTDLQSYVKKPVGHSIQARIYAEDSFHSFRPSAGRLDGVALSDLSRNEVWIRDGMDVTTLYDPMLGKIIVHGKNREDALSKLSLALSETRLFGITTNLLYLQSLLQEEACQTGDVYTKLLDDFVYGEKSLEVIDGGIQTTVQDYPARKGYWDVGVPPSGPMDALSFRMGNILLGNHEGANGLELTLRGGSYRFRSDLLFCITGADMQAKLDEEDVPMYTPIEAKRGQIISFGEAQEGMRTYLLVAGGFDMPSVLGSSSTFTLGGFGGHGGRALQVGDVLNVKEVSGNAGSVKKALPLMVVPEQTKEWTIRVIPGPHCTGEFLQEEYLTQLTETKWEVHFNSSRTGVRLIGPVPLWAREDGGDAGLHPSNIHDNPYAIGSLDLTGDMPILLGPDGPSLGGFVCPVTTATAELWKIGQLHPGDKVMFELISIETAQSLYKQQEQLLKGIEEGDFEISQSITVPTEHEKMTSDYPILARETSGREFPITIRCCGDEYLLVEYGDLELDLLNRFKVHALMEAIVESDDVPYIDVTPGVRSLQVHVDRTKIDVREACKKIMEIDGKLPPLGSISVSSRIVKLPLSWDDPASQLAQERYHKNIRPDAPWCPSNIEFIRRINGLSSIEEVKNIVFDANYLVLGLGDVYLGAPLATPVDPRHRLVTTKYNPSRTWTADNTVGIGGAYMCIYGMEGPGGYQLIGRTLPIWNTSRETNSFSSDKPWLLRFFDQIQYYPVEAEELLQMREDFIRGKFEIEVEETTFQLGEYLAFLDEIKDSTKQFRDVQQAAYKRERERWIEQGISEYISEVDVAEVTEETLKEGEMALRSSMPGSVWKILVTEGQKVSKGDTLIIEESMKMEFPQLAPCDGVVTAVFVKSGDTVSTNQLLITIKKEIPVVVNL